MQLVIVGFCLADSQDKCAAWRGLAVRTAVLGRSEKALGSGKAKGCVAIIILLMKINLGIRVGCKLWMI